MGLDYRAQLESSLWTKLEANAGFVTAFKAGRRFKNTGDGWLRQHWMIAPADFPQIKIEVRGNPIPPVPPKVFAMNATTYTSATVNLTVPIAQQVAIILTYDKRKTADQSPLETIVDKVLWGAWPKLGLSWVIGFNFSATKRDITVESVLRPQTTFAINFQLRPWLSDLTS